MVLKSVQTDQGGTTYGLASSSFHACGKVGVVERFWDFGLGRGARWAREMTF